MAMDEEVKEGGVDGLNCGTVLNNFKTRRQVNIGAKPQLPKFPQMEELKKKLAALSKENGSMKTSKVHSHNGNGYPKQGYERNDSGREVVKEAFGPGEFSRPCVPSYCCDYCPVEGQSARFCFEFKDDESHGLVKIEGRDYFLPDGKLIPFDPRRPIITVVAEYSSKNTTVDKGKEFKKQGEALVGILKSSAGKIDWWSRSAVPSISRVSVDVYVVRKVTVQTSRRSTSLNKDVEKERDAILEKLQTRLKKIWRT